ncbi:breast cancer metastasis-suppressor 1-like protein isoform X1 [Centruroides vittatus]|uniref:breast cancer metastasis-suppressor 1-like protein isoform X1 n=2 Tax=Centruroides sculpturatus TaxID=218467 RepID=UPI000C6E52E1|nr:breast cancer metastasis-suppressor 1-like protein isoform X1 [Centruroides sculpturatus]
MEISSVITMPGIKEEINESDGEELDQDSPESEKTSNEESDSISGSGTEDDDSSEMDEEDCERRRTECIVDMADLEKQFMILKEQLYKERSTQIDKKLGEVKTGQAPEYLQPLEELQENMRIRTEVAGILKELKMTNIRNKHEAEKLASEQNFESEKSLLKDSIKCELEEKIRRLEEDRNSIDITSDLWNEQVNPKKNKRRTDPLNPDKRKKPVTVSGPYIVYLLHENEILEDWTTIRKALKAAKQKSDYEFAPVEQRFNARFTDGKLLFKGEWFHKGEPVILENKTETIMVQLISMNTSEVVLQKQDGVCLRLCISDFQTGRYSIHHSPD